MKKNILQGAFFNTPTVYFFKGVNFITLVFSSLIKICSGFLLFTFLISFCSSLTFFFISIYLAYSIFSFFKLVFLSLGKLFLELFITFCGLLNFFILDSSRSTILLSIFFFGCLDSFFI